MSNTPSNTPAPFANCRYTYCDLPGQCLGEGKCHHPKEATSNPPAGQETPRVDACLSVTRWAATKLNEAAKQPGGVTFVIPDPNAPPSIEDVAAQLAEWFKKGQESIRRKNQSGCCCNLGDDGEEVIGACGLHQEWLEAQLATAREDMKEECAKVCDREAGLTDYNYLEYLDILAAERAGAYQWAAKAIRALK